jgi:hypothetical protein
MLTRGQRRPAPRSWRAVIARNVSLLLLSACAASPAPAPTTPVALRELLAAPAEQWAAAIAKASPLSPADSAALARALQAEPLAPGAPAAVGLLGLHGCDEGDQLLARLVADRGALATEAALALGDRRYLAAEAALADAMSDHAADPALRAAAATSLVRFGRAPLAASFLRAILLAGSPAGAEPARAHGLPQRPRWALERYLIQRMLLREGEPDLAAALDPDASWPELLQLAERLSAWLARR